LGFTSKFFVFFRGIKADGQVLFLTIYEYHQIFVCNSQDGKVVNKWGTETMSSKQGEFNYAMGITADNQNLYICDCDNHRVQILTKNTGLFVTQWGSDGRDLGYFRYPFSIYHCLIEDMFYIGDNYSIQLFSPDGYCHQRIGGRIKGPKMSEFSGVYGVCVIDDQLYVSDYENARIQIFFR